MSLALTLLLMSAIVLGTILLVVTNVIVVSYMERKVLGDLQVRYGPMRVGPHGLLQIPADVLKMLLKEDTTPANADRWLFNLAPLIVVVPAFMLYLVLPINETWIIADMDIGIFFIFAVSAIIPIGVIIAGWASYNKYSLLGAFRSAAQQISYEIPLLLSILGVIMITGSLSLVEIVKAQSETLFGVLPRWFIFLQPFAFLFFLISAVADLNRTPFDIPEAESELVSGFNTEYSGIKFGLFFLGEYSNTFLLSALVALLFLGGWNGPLLPPVLWFLIKTYAIVFVIIWFRGTFPRVRIDQLMNLGWKVLLPLTLANILITGMLMVL